MIAFGCSIIAPDVFERCAAVGLTRAREDDSEVFACQAAGAIFRSYNLILDRFAGRDDLEALVLVHEDAEILDRELGRHLREALRDPDVAIVGCVGAIGVQSIAWWEGATTRGTFVHRYPELGGGEFLAFDPPDDACAQDGGCSEVDSVDGFFMALSPWAVRNLRFDESLGPHWGYDLDLCLQARAGGRKVVVADLRVAHHRSLVLVPDTEPWVAAHTRAAEKWEGRLRAAVAEPEGEIDWRSRARRAEAEAVVARLYGASLLLQADARVLEHARRLERITRTRSWWLTTPLRRVNAWRRESARGRESGISIVGRNRFAYQAARRLRGAAARGAGDGRDRAA